ncbi:MAG TPA: hypothetical protein VFT22_41570 [Kofleriaceae bacterium]|nr:hypothetical protein [Kofleriaceae bacterium]
MIWLAAALGLIAASALGIALVGARARRRGALPIVPPELAARLAAARAAFADAAAWQPASAADAPAAAAAIEAALIAGEPLRALELAEAALASALPPPGVGGAGSPAEGPGAPVRVWLAWALCASGQPRAALDQLAKAGAPRGALAHYVMARAGHLLFEHGHGATGAVPPLITTGDLAVVTLGRGRGSAAWLAGSTDVQLSSAQVEAALAEHREVTARCLAGALDALDEAPGFADAAYLSARLAVKAGLIGAARPLFDALAPRMIGRPDAAAFERDREDLADPARALAAARQKPPERGQRSRSLRVLP